MSVVKIQNVSDGQIVDTVSENYAGKGFVVTDDKGNETFQRPILFKIQKPAGDDGQQRDQTADAAKHMRYAASLGLPKLRRRLCPRLGRAIIVGGAPSIKDHLETIRELSQDKHNAVFAINWSHTWLLQNGITPRGCVFFEIDAEPDTVLKNASKDVTYFICSHCHEKTFDMLKDYKRVIWHSPPNSEIENQVHQELFQGEELVGGGISTFTRSMSVAMYLGYRHFDLFGCDSSFPKGKSHVDGYETVMKVDDDTIEVWALDPKTNERRSFTTYGYLAYQHEEFKIFCQHNHQHFSLRVHGDSLLRFSHQCAYPDQYDPDKYVA